MKIAKWILSVSNCQWLLLMSSEQVWSRLWMSVMAFVSYGSLDGKKIQNKNLLIISTRYVCCNVFMARSSRVVDSQLPLVYRSDLSLKKQPRWQKLRCVRIVVAFFTIKWKPFQNAKPWAKKKRLHLVKVLEITVREQVELSVFIGCWLLNSVVHYTVTV